MYHGHVPGVLKSNTDFLGSSNETLASIKGYLYSKRPSIARLNIDTLFMDINSLRVGMIMLKAQILPPPSNQN